MHWLNLTTLISGIHIAVRSDGSAAPFSQIFWRDLCWDHWSPLLCRDQITTPPIIMTPPVFALHHLETGRERKLNKRGENWIFFISFRRLRMSLMTSKWERGEGNQIYFSYDYHQCLFIPPVSSPQYKVFTSWRKEGLLWLGLCSTQLGGKTSEGKGRVAILKVASLHLCPLNGLRSFQILKQNISL